MITWRQLLSLLAVFFVVLLLSSRVFAHGVEGTVQRGGLLVVCRYSTGEVMDYAKVTVLAPGSSQPFQVGHADKNGRFCFFPDAPGEWRLTAEDGMGHRLEIKVPVALDQVKGAQVKTVASTPPASLFARALVGLSLIFGLAGLLFYWRAMRVKH